MQCNSLIGGQFPLALSALLAGLVGSVSHCSLMCSPIVAAQMLDLQASHKPQWQMSYYHAGRVATYMILGMVAARATGWLFGGALSQVSGVMLLVAGSIFIFSALMPKRAHRCCSKASRGLLERIDRIAQPAIKYFMRGLFMGFMPCGMLISILLMVAATQNVLSAVAVMGLFGLATIPTLQAVGYSAITIGKKYPHRAAQVGRVAMTVNGFALWATGFGLIHT